MPIDLVQMNAGFRYKVTKNPDEIAEDDVVIDSTFDSPPRCRRIDHHSDNGWTSLDSICRADLSDLRARRSGTIATSYLDPDAIIGAAVLNDAVFGDLALRSFLNTHIGRIFYSAAHWCDYQVDCGLLRSDANAVGNKVEIWLRERINQEIRQGTSTANGTVEDRASDSDSKGALHSTVLTTLSEELSAAIRARQLPAEVQVFDVDGWLLDNAAIFARCVRPDLGTRHFGVVHIIGPQKARVIPRAYFSHFSQPMIVRVIQEKLENRAKKQVMIGPNPLVSGWQSLNLEKLSAFILRKNPHWKLTGRRFVIGDNGIEHPLAALLTVLREVELADMTDRCPMWSVYD